MNDNNWHMPFSLLTTLEPDKNSIEDYAGPLPIKWFRYNDQKNFQDTEIEKAENTEAIKEQISLGILIPVPTGDGKVRLEINDGKPRFNTQQVRTTPVVVQTNSNPRVSPVLRYVQTIETSNKRQSPNELCACGSGKKYKKCHGR